VYNSAVGEEKVMAGNIHVGLLMMTIINNPERFRKLSYAMRKSWNDR